MENQKPTVGRIVHYKLRQGANKGETRPGVIVRVWDNDCVQLKVLLDEANDHDAETFASSCLRADSPLAKDPEGLGCWSWPPRG